jgi:type IV pilus assembly protein PilM
MAKTQTAIGIDFGAHALKAVVLRKRGSRISLARAGAVPLGDLAFLDDSPRKDQRLGELLRTLRHKAHIHGRTAASGLAGRDYFVKYLHVPPAPPDKLRKLIEYEVTEDPASQDVNQTNDFWLLDLPTKGEEFTVLVAMARDEALNRRLGLLKRAHFTTNGLTLNAIALFNAYEHALDEDIFNDETVLLVDIGAEHMEVAFQHNGKLLFVRNLTHGGRRFSEALQEEFKLPIAEAEELKLNQGAILPRHIDVAAEIDTESPEARISAALLDPAESIYDTLQATINYCKAQTRMTSLKVDRIVLSGRGARLRGLREFLAQRCHVPVDMLEPFTGIDTSELPARDRDEVIVNASSYTVAIGLALRELDPARTHPISLLPADVQRKKEFLARDAYLYAGAAVFLLAFGAMLYTSDYAAAKEQQRASLMQRAVERAGDTAGRFDGLKQRNDILSGQAEALKRLFDTGRRCVDSIAVLKRHLPPQLCVDSISTVTESPDLGPRRREAKPQDLKLTTHLLIEGTVAEKDGDTLISVAAAKNIVNKFMDSLLTENHLFRNAKVTKHPGPGEPQDRRTFKMEVFYAAPFYGAEGRERTR